MKIVMEKIFWKTLLAETRWYLYPVFASTTHNRRNSR